jgi:hypothetical protein
MVYRLSQVWLEITSGATVTITCPAQLSPVITEAVFGAGTFSAQDTVRLTGQVMVGVIASNTLIV